MSNRPIFHWLCLFFCSLLPILSLASEQPLQLTDAAIVELYHSQGNNPNKAIPVRLESISRQFLGKPYLLGALGEGRGGRFDKSPLYRLDAFDCETFVTTVLALALSNNLADFKNNIIKIRYANQKIGFLTRNHFTGLDWNKNNQKHGFLQDITESITDSSHHPIAANASALIDKPSWYQHFTLKNIKLGNSKENQQAQRLAELKLRGSQLPRQTETIPYLPLTALFDSDGKPFPAVFKQIPNGAIIEIIRPDWDLSKEAGTHLNVSHMGFAFWKNKQLFFRQASSIYGKIVDVPLTEYLKQALHSPTIKGINVQVVPRKIET